MSTRRNKFDAEGNYLLPSERVAAAHVDDDEDVFIGGDEFIGGDDLEVADHIARSMPSSDGLAQRAALRQEKWKRQDIIAPYARINPPSANRGTLGGQQEVPTGQNRQVANWGADSDEETTPVTITFCPTQQVELINGDVIAGPILRPFGIVQFGTRGFLVKAEVDIGRGTQFTVGASMVTLQVALENVAVAPGTMKLAGMLSFFPVTRTVPVTRTLYADAIADGSVASFQVPAFAKNVVFWRGSPTQPTSAVILTFIDTSGFGIYDFNIPAGAFMLDPVPLSDDVAFILITNSGPGAITSGRLIFELSF